MDVDIFNIFETLRGKLCFNIDSYKFSEYRVLINGYSNFRLYLYWLFCNDIIMICVIRSYIFNHAGGLFEANGPKPVKVRRKIYSQTSSDTRDLRQK